MVQRSPNIPSQSYLDYIDLRDRNQTFESLSATQIIGEVGVNSGGNPTTVWPTLASGNYFDTLGLQPYLGRFFHAADEKGMDSAPYVVLSYDFWHTYFRGDPAVIGRNVEINKHAFTILGVAQPKFRGTELFFAPAFWIPIVEQPTVMGSNQLQYRGNHSPGRSAISGRESPYAQATADLELRRRMVGQNLSL